MATNWQSKEAPETPRKPIPKRFIVLGVLAFMVAGLFGLLCLLKLAGDRAQSTSCVMNMKNIGYAGRLWAQEHNGLLPTNFITMSNELVTPQILHCRVDRMHQRANSFEEFSEQQNNSYMIVTPGARQGATNVVFIRCSVHGHLGLADGEVRRADSEYSVPILK